MSGGGPAPARGLRLLVSGALHRPDILGILDGVRDRAALHFVEYDSPDPLRGDEVYAGYGPVERWEASRSAQALLDRVRPDRVVLFYLTALNQVALRVAARERGIPVIHLEHGVRLPAEGAVIRGVLAGDAWRRVHPRRWASAVAHAARQAFFLRTAAEAGGRARAELLAYGALALPGGGHPRVLTATAGIRRADAYCSFAPECLAFHRTLDRLPAGWPAWLVGFPQFDAFRDEAGPDGGAALLVEHQLHNDRRLGWTLAHRERWVSRFADALRARGLPLLVKLHPGDRSGAWERQVGPGITLLPDLAAVSAAAPRVRLVLGTFSTLLLPLAALRHTTVITLEDHPEPGLFPSRVLVDAGVAEAAFTTEALLAALDRVPALHARQAPHKRAFAARFLHALDGRSGARLGAALLGELPAPGPPSTPVPAEAP